MSVYDEKVTELLSRMTVEEKVGQLQQCGPSLVGAFEVSFEELLNMMFDGRISQEGFGRLMSTAKQDVHEEDLRAGKIGSYNGVSDVETANRLVDLGVRGIWNFTTQKLSISDPSVKVEKIHFGDSLLALSYMISEE